MILIKLTIVFILSAFIGMSIISAKPANNNSTVTDMFDRNNQAEYRPWSNHS